MQINTMEQKEQNAQADLNQQRAQSLRFGLKQHISNTIQKQDSSGHAPEAVPTGAHEQPADHARLEMRPRQTVEAERASRK